MLYLFIFLVVMATVAGIVKGITGGEINSMLVCPHCGTKGAVRTMSLQRKRGISGGKVMVGILTGGISLLGTGLSRKEWVTHAHCDACSSTWEF